jgi:hypothetical protein
VGRNIQVFKKTKIFDPSSHSKKETTLQICKSPLVTFIQVDTFFAIFEKRIKLKTPEFIFYDHSKQLALFVYFEEQKPGKNWAEVSGTCISALPQHALLKYVRIRHSRCT